TRRGVAARRRWRTCAVAAGLVLATAARVDVVDLLLDAADRLVGRVQLRTVHRVGAGRADAAGRDVGDLAFVAGTAHADNAGRGIASEYIGRPTNHGAGGRIRCRRDDAGAQCHVIGVIGNGTLAER